MPNLPKSGFKKPRNEEMSLICNIMKELALKIKCNGKIYIRYHFAGSAKRFICANSKKHKTAICK